MRGTGAETKVPDNGGPTTYKSLPLANPMLSLDPAAASTWQCVGA
jgi:hypothetical protein